MWSFFVLSMLCVTFAVAYMIAIFPAKGITNQVKLVTGYAWLTTLMICCIVPLDVVSTLHGESPKAISILWDIPYWSTQALTWFLIPTYMEYSNAGEFTWKGRMWRAVKSNLTFYLTMGAFGAVGLAWGTLRGTLDLATLPSLGMQLSNTFGLVCVLALMGFGLVNIPRSLWKHSKPEALLRFKYYQLGKIVEERDTATHALNQAVGKVMATKRVLGRGERESLAHIEDMLAFIRAHIGEDVEASAGLLVDQHDYADELPQLHAEVLKEVYIKGTINARAVYMIKTAIWLSEVRNTRAGREPRPGGFALEYQQAPHSRLMWNFWCFVWPYVLKTLAVLTAALGALILWCEATIGLAEDVSPLSKLVHHVHGEFIDQAIVLALLVYVITCTYTAFFAIGIGSMYTLTPGASSSFSLLFNGTLMARFAAPLCFNYLHVIRMNTPQEDGRYTTFATKMGLDKMENVAIPFLAIGFNEWAPWLLIAVVFLVSSNAIGFVYRHLFCCLPQGYVNSEENEDSNRYVMEGERLVERERENVQAGRGLGQHNSMSLLSNAAAYQPSVPAQPGRAAVPNTGGTSQSSTLLSSILPKTVPSVSSPSSMATGLLSGPSSAAVSPSKPDTRTSELARKYGRVGKKS